MLDVLWQACQAMIVERSDAWLISGFLENSYETGGSEHRKVSLKSLECAPFPSDLLQQIKGGVNGNLEDLIRRNHRELGPIEANKKKGCYRPDLEYGANDPATHTLVEVKCLFDSTLRKYYESATGILKDQAKLQQYRQDELEPFKGHLFQVVTFLQMPNYDYPAGCSYPPTWKRSPPRKAHLVYPSIAEQYAKAVYHLGFPERSLWTWPLAVPSEMLCGCLSQWMEMNFKADDPNWQFHPLEQASGAAIGFAIWQY